MNLRAASAIEVLLELVILRLVHFLADLFLLQLDIGAILEPIQRALLFELLQFCLVIRQVQYGAVSAVQTRLRLLVVLVFFD